MYYLLNINPFILTIISTFFTFLITTLGSAIVFFFKKTNKNILNIMLSLSAGIMIAASFFSLLNPAIEMSKKININICITLLIGFILGSLFLYITDKYFNKINKKRSLLLILSITLHNIPEGMAIGVAFASTKYQLTTISSALLLALGIGIQNFPEGSAISLPLRMEGNSRLKSFIIGSMSGFIEIISGIIGYLLVLKIRILLPYLLSFAASAMIYVAVKELIPASQENEKKDLMTLITLSGFLIMMLLDIALG